MLLSVTRKVLANVRRPEQGQHADGRSYEVRHREDDTRPPELTHRVSPIPMAEQG